MSFTIKSPGVRKVQTEWNDTLQKVSQRELGTASRWVELANLNNLKPPYIVNTREEQRPNVLLAGDSISIPAPLSANSMAYDEDGIFLCDINLENGLLTSTGGGLSPVKGLDNLTQALTIRLMTEKGELMHHPEYGDYLILLKGKNATPANQGLGAFYAMSCLMEDERVKSVEQTVVTINADTMTVEALVQPIYERTIKLIAQVK